MDTPQKSSLPFPNVRVFSKLFIGFGSGFVGSIVLGIILFFTWSIVGNALSDISTNQSAEEMALASLDAEEQAAHPLFLSVVMFGVFLSALLANLTYVILSTSLFNRADIRSTALTHAFIGNIILGLLMLLVYIIGNISFGASGVSALGLFHWAVSVIFTVLSLEMLHQSKYALVNLYGLILGLCLFGMVGSLLAVGNIALVAFLSLPLLMACLGVGDGWAEWFYNKFYHSFGSDVLNVQTRFGDDYGQKDAQLEQVDDLDL